MSANKTKAFTNKAIAQIESKSIREWASSAHNRPIIEKMAANALAKDGESADPTRFATYLVCVAMGM